MKRSAFTLLELLVVAAVVALLSALVAGGVAHGKMAAQRVACMNNLKQWGYATHLYADEQEDILPRESAVDGINAWEMTGSSTSRDVWYNALAETLGVTTMPDTPKRHPRNMSSTHEETCFIVRQPASRLWPPPTRIFHWRSIRSSCSTTKKGRPVRWMMAATPGASSSAKSRCRKGPRCFSMAAFRAKQCFVLSRLPTPGSPRLMPVNSRAVT